MDNNKTMIFGILAMIGLVVWGPVVASLTKLLFPDADILLIYLLNKGIFAAVLLAVMSKVGGWKFFGIHPSCNWWFLVPGLPFLLLTVMLLINPEAPFGLGATATAGWIFMSIFVGIGKECVFRGILWRSFESRGTLVTAVLTSVLFGAVHLVGLFADIPWQIVVSQAVFAFGVGMMFAAVRLVSGSLVAPIILHAVFDAAAIVAAGGLNEMFDDTLSVARLLVPGAIFAAWGLANILIIQRFNGGESNKSDSVATKKHPGIHKPLHNGGQA